VLTEADDREKIGILGLMLRSPVIKDILRTNLSGMSPATGSDLVRTLLREDPEVFFAVIGSLPVVVNAFVKAWTELALQLRDKYTPEMLTSFVMSLFQDIDRDAAGRCCAAWGGLMTSLWDASDDLRAEAGRTILRHGPGVVSACVNRCTRRVNAVEPIAFGTFLARVLDGIDRPEMDRAVKTMAGALFDQKWRIGLWAWSFVKERFMKRFGRGAVPSS